MNGYVAIAFVGIGLVGCTDTTADDQSRHTESNLRADATVQIAAAPGGSCERACFDVNSSKDIGFIAVDAEACGAPPVAWSLAAIAEDGTQTPVGNTPAPHGNGKSCPLVPQGALKFDDLAGKHFVVCASGAKRADVFAKSGKTCAGESFEMAPPKLELFASIDPQGCNLTTFYETWNVEREDGTPLPFGSYTCQWTFDDGGTSDSCNGYYTFAAPGFHTGQVTVTEIGTGATGADSVGPRPIWDVLAIEVVATAPPCGLSFDYTITKTGGKPTGGFNFLSVAPYENVLTVPVPAMNGGTVEVSAPGTYVVGAYREEETSFSLCSASDTTEVTVVACP